MAPIFMPREYASDAGQRRVSKFHHPRRRYAIGFAGETVHQPHLKRDFLHMRLGTIRGGIEEASCTLECGYMPLHAITYDVQFCTCDLVLAPKLHEHALRNCSDFCGFLEARCRRIAVGDLRAVLLSWSFTFPLPSPLFLLLCGFLEACSLQRAAQGCIGYSWGCNCKGPLDAFYCLVCYFRICSNASEIRRGE